MSRVPEYKQDKEDKFFLWKGVKPPERTSHGFSEDDIDDKLAEQIQGHQCQYYQQGSFIKCDVAGFEHGKHIGVNKRLSPDYTSGEPILVDITFS